KPLSEAERSEFDRKRRIAFSTQVGAERLENGIRHCRLEVRNKLHLLEQLYQQLEDRLAQLQQGRAPRFRDEAELWWDVLTSTHSQIRELNAAYYLLSFASKAEQEEYVKHPNSRKEMIDRVLSVAYVRDDRGRYMAVTL